jgi:hypothetical protein
VLTGNRAGEKGGGLIAVGGKLVNNTFSDNVAPEGGALYLWISPYLLANNIVAFNSSGLAVHDEAGWVWPDPEPLRAYNNLFFANAGGDFGGPPAVIDTTPFQGNLHADPLYIDRAGGDYHPKAGSPTIDAGIDVYVQPSDTDRDGNSRIQGRHVDIGAYETIGALGYRWWDAVRALKLAAGLAPYEPIDWRLDVSGNPRLPPQITMADAARLMRKAMGSE